MDICTDPLDGTHKPAFAPPATWPEADELLRSGDYDRLGQMLKAHRDAGDATRAAVLDAAEQLCLSCIELHRQQGDHYQAAQRAGRLEEDACLRLRRLMGMLGEDGLPVAAELPAQPDVPTGRWATLWRRAVLVLRRPNPEPPASPPVFLLPAPEPPAVHETASAVDGPTADLHVYTLGRFRVYHHDRALDGWTGQKSRSLFKHLLIHRDAPVHTEQLLDYFWGDSSPDMARRSLYQTIYLVRQALQALGRPVIIQVNGGYQFNPELNVWVDCETFMGQYHVGLEAAGRGDDDGLMVALLAAEALYEGEFMAEDPYEEWPVARREQLRNAYLDALDRLSRHFWATREDGPCIVYCRKLLEIDACREDIHRRLMRVFARRGERSLALRQYLRCVEALREELDVEPLADTTRLYRQVLENELHF